MRGTWLQAVLLSALVLALTSCTNCCDQKSRCGVVIPPTYSGGPIRRFKIINQTPKPIVVTNAATVGRHGETIDAPLTSHPLATDTTVPVSNFFCLPNADCSADTCDAEPWNYVQLSLLVDGHPAHTSSLLSCASCSLPIASIHEVRISYKG